MTSHSLDQPTAGHFIGHEHRLPVRVYFEDTDAGGVVYHANYLRFMERARTDMLRLSGIAQRTAMESGEGVYAVTSLAIRYRRPARLDDALTVRSRVVGLKAASCAIQQRVMREEELVAEADVTVAFLGTDGRPKRQPAAWIETFRRLQGETGPT
jgi:acyl-CoA thioester hydrolase